ncbi:hypothetical protein GCM10027519_47630 [Kineococcus endophyticus]
MVEALQYLEGLGWRIRKQGHKVRIYCPCGDADGRGAPVGGTVRDAGNVARRIRRLAEHCPDAHDLISPTGRAGH